MDIMDFANDDNFRTSWRANPDAKDRWFEVDLKQQRSFNTVVIFEEKPNIRNYKIESCTGGTCRVLFEGENGNPFKVHRFSGVTGDKVRISILASATAPSVAEIGVYNEPRD
jgi:alpha-L-fucosidase